MKLTHLFLTRNVGHQAPGFVGFRKTWCGLTEKHEGHFKMSENTLVTVDCKKCRLYFYKAS